MSTSSDRPATLRLLLRLGCRVVKKTSGYKPASPNPGTVSNGAAKPHYNACSYCGYLDWTVEKYGRVTHKEGCPMRTDPWHQGDPHPETRNDPLALLMECLNDSEPWSAEALSERMEAVFVALGGIIEEGEAHV